MLKRGCRLGLGARALASGVRVVLPPEVAQPLEHLDRVLAVERFTHVLPPCLPLVRQIESRNH